MPNVVDIGFSSTVIRFGASVARVARNRDAAAGHAREAATLRVVDGRVPVAVPAPLRLIPPEAHLPFGAALQPFLPGRVMRPEDLQPDAALPRNIAGTLAALHQLDAGMFPDGALLELDPIVELRRLNAAAVPWVRERLSAPLRRSLDDAWGRCAEVLPGRERVVCHGDAWFGNISFVAAASPCSSTGKKPVSPTRAWIWPRSDTSAWMTRRRPSPHTSRSAAPS